MKGFLIFTLVFYMFNVFSQSFDELAQTPPMGWNSWNSLRCNGINEKAIKEIADAMVSSGMKDAGYEYVVVDDCWQIGRDKEGNILVDEEKFPSGMKALADYIHSKGLKFGLYSCAGEKTCQGRPGSRGYQFQDARQYAEWGVDYLKYDWCYSASQNAEGAYRTMSDAIKASGRPMVFSICDWGYSEPWKWGKGVGHLWRTTHDIRDCWDCQYNVWGTVSGGILKILDANRSLNAYAGPGHWNDPDMLEVGNEALTEAESRAHFSLWCLMAAPLMAGNDLRSMDETTREILTNKEVIAVNQDPLGKQGKLRVTYDGGDLEVYRKILEDGQAYLFFNRSDEPYELDLTWAMLEVEENYRIRDLWKHEDLLTTLKKPAIKYVIEPHGVKMFRLVEVKE